MSIVYLASYKGVHEGIAGLVNRGIRYMDKTIYSHSEICIGNPFQGEVECFSSSGVDHGVRKKTMRLNPDKWDIITLPNVTAEHVRSCYERTRGLPYDYIGTCRFMFPMFLREHPKRWFCSEWVTWVMGHNDPWRFSPAGCLILGLAGNGVIVTE